MVNKTRTKEEIDRVKLVEEDHPESKMSSSSRCGTVAAKEEVAITIEKPWITTLEQTLDNYSSNCLQDNMTPRDFPTIFKVPKNIRSHDPKAYEPTMVSLGPYHHHKEHLQPMDKLKLYYLRKFLNRNRDSSLADYIQMIRHREREARSAYSEQVEMSSDYFVRMMLLDCCFVLEIISSILELLIAEAKHKVVDNADTGLEELVVNPIIITPCSWTALARDMLLIENQLPFFLLQLLFDRAHYKRGVSNLSRLALLFFYSQTSWPVNTAFSGEEIHHFLHLFHSSIAPPPLSERKKNNNGSKPPPEDDDDNRVPLQLLPSAVQLKEAGVHLKKKKSNDSKENFLCITFDKGKMEIPRFIVTDGTNILFRNLIAFEQCYYYTLSRPLHMGIEINYFTAYAVLMDCIISTEADVNLLVQKEIILDGLGSGQEVARLFNDLCRGVIINGRHGHLSDVFKSVNEHWSRKSNRWMAKLNHDYFSSPWASISLAGVFILFFLTMAQTIYTILSYYKQ